MSSTFRTACWISLALAIGMVSQEFVARLVADDRSTVDIRDLTVGRWNDRETFYAEARLTNDPRWEPATAAASQALAEATPAISEEVPETSQSLRPLIASHVADEASSAEESTEPAIRVATLRPELRGIAAERAAELLAQNRVPPEPADYATAVSPPVEPSLGSDVVTGPVRPVLEPAGSSPDDAQPATAESTADILPPPATERIRRSSRSPEDYATQLETEPSVAIEPVPEEPSQYEQATAIIQQQAAERAAQRRQRIELRKWMGYSAARPSVTATPMMAGETYRPAMVLVPVIVREGQTERR
jgi:hypothetical protein